MCICAYMSTGKPVLTISIFIWHYNSDQLEPMVVSLVGEVNAYYCWSKLYVQFHLELTLHG